MTRTYETLLVTREGPIATVRLNRPGKRNSIGGPMMVELYETLSELAAAPDVRVVVLRGEGADFCPGADVKHYGGGDAAPARPGWSSTREFNVSVLLHEMPAVTIAAIRGACAGAGFGWACACDLRLACETARFNSAFLDVGVGGDMGGPGHCRASLAPPRRASSTSCRASSTPPRRTESGWSRGSHRPATSRRKCRA